MTITTVPADEWTEVVTTTTDTVFVNRGSRTLFISTEDTEAADLDDGVALGPNEGIVIADGYAVTVSSPSIPTEVFYMPIGIPPA